MSRGSKSQKTVIVEAVRTAIGKGSREKGQYGSTHPNELLGACFKELFSRTGLEPIKVDDVVIGCVQQRGEQALNVGRNAWLQAGLPVEVPATTVDRQCGSSQQALNSATALIDSGACDIVVVGGVEHMGHVPFPTISEDENPFPPALFEKHQLVPQGFAAELIADKWQIGREEMDTIALRSQQLANQATVEGRFEREIVPIETASGQVTTDQGIRPGSSLEALSNLKPAFRPEDGRVTAGNSSQISDGASAMLLMSEGKAKELGLKPRAEIVDHLTVGVDPVLMLTGPIPATQKLLDRTGMQLSDIDLFEINEAFASVIAAWQRELNPDMDRVNVNGGAIALGHPLGASGTRLATTLLHELERSDGEVGLVSMCCFGGLGTGTLIKRM